MAKARKADSDVRVVGKASVAAAFGQHPLAAVPTTPACSQSPTQDPHAIRDPREKVLEVAIGREVRALRKKFGITVADLAGATNLSLGMLSKIEHGTKSPSLTTLQSLSDALGLRHFSAATRRTAAPYSSRRGTAFMSKDAEPGPDASATCWDTSAQTAVVSRSSHISLPCRKTPTYSRCSSTTEWNSCICWKARLFIDMAAAGTRCCPVTACSLMPMRPMDRKNLSGCRCAIYRSSPIRRAVGTSRSGRLRGCRARFRVSRDVGIVG
jgi:transcriptional regulator with XRE-family HTH domain